MILSEAFRTAICVWIALFGIGCQTVQMPSAEFKTPWKDGKSTLRTDDPVTRVINGIIVEFRSKNADPTEWELRLPVVIRAIDEALSKENMPPVSRHLSGITMRIRDARPQQTLAGKYHYGDQEWTIDLWLKQNTSSPERSAFLHEIMHLYDDKELKLTAKERSTIIEGTYCRHFNSTHLVNYVEKYVFKKLDVKNPPTYRKGCD